MSSSCPYASVTPGDLVTEDVRIPVARVIRACVARIIPGDDREYIDSVLYSQNPRGFPSHFMASTIHSRVSKRLVRSLIRELWFPDDVTILIPRMTDTICNPPVDYFSVYVDHVRAGF